MANGCFAKYKTAGEGERERRRDESVFLILGISIESGGSHLNFEKNAISAYCVKMEK